MSNKPQDFEKLAELTSASFGVSMIQKGVSLIFGFIGLVFLCFLWTDNTLGGSPLFFRLFGSGIALVFMLTGFGTTFVSPLSKLRQMQELAQALANQTNSQAGTTPADDKPSADLASNRYVCAHCGAGLASGAEVSPHGDVKCTHCGQWFNIHQG